MKSRLQSLKLVVTIVALIISSITFAQQGINYQGVARDVNSDVLANTNITLGLDIIKTNAGGTTVYSETHNATTDANGVFSVVIGEGTPTLNVFTDINWAEDKHFLKVTLDGQEVGTTEFMATPYTNAIGKWQAHKNGVTPKGTGGSVFIGEDAGQNDDFTDNNNIGVGDEALATVSTGHDNIAVGELALNLNRSGFYNIGIGDRALEGNITGYGNIGLGSRSLTSNTSGNYNVAMGIEALASNTTGVLNIALGRSSLKSNTEGHHNVALGDLVLRNNTTGESNFGSGINALYTNTTGNENIAIGTFSMFFNETGSHNVAFGHRSLQDNTTGSNNIAIGESSQSNNTEGRNNTSVGANTLANNNTSINNTAIGHGALRLLNDVNNIPWHGNNVALGAYAMEESINGKSNVMVGYRSGAHNLGNGNVFIGAFSGNAVAFKNAANTLIIDNRASPKPLIYGEFDNEIIGFNAKVGIGHNTPTVPLHVRGGSDVTLSNASGIVVIGNETWTNIAIDNNEIQARDNGTASDLYLQTEGGNVRVGGAVVHSSDKRLKRDIEDLSYGLNEVLKLRPTEYFWKGKEQEHKSLGLIAQEVDEVIKNVVTYNEEQDKYGVSYTELIPVLIKALQEQQDIINKQDKTIQGFEARLQALEGSLVGN